MPEPSVQSLNIDGLVPGSSDELTPEIMPLFWWGSVKMDPPRPLQGKTCVAGPEQLLGVPQPLTRRLSLIASRLAKNYRRLDLRASPHPQLT